MTTVDFGNAVVEQTQNTTRTRTTPVTNSSKDTIRVSVIDPSHNLSVATDSGRLWLFDCIYSFALELRQWHFEVAGVHLEHSYHLDSFQIASGGLNCIPVQDQIVLGHLNWIVGIDTVD
jgi:hypothetical protein